jgi:hypothetical protein
MMGAIAVIAVLLGALMAAPWIYVLMLITLPQTLIVAACAFQATRKDPAPPALRRSRHE